MAACLLLFLSSLSYRLERCTPARHGPSGVHAKPVESVLACDCVTKLSSGTPQLVFKALAAREDDDVEEEEEFT